MKKRCLVFLMDIASACATSSPYVYQEFDLSMQKNTSEYMAKYDSHPSNRSKIENLKKLYTKNNALQVITSKTPKIPRIIHQIWVGPHPLPKFYQMLTETWKAKHPDWTYILWTDAQVKKLKLHNQRAYDRAHSLSEKANILRYELLYWYGGVYADIDFECLQPLDVLNHCYEFYTGITPNNCSAVLANGLIGSKPHHPLLNMLILHMHKFEHEANQYAKNGVYYFSEIVNNYIQEEHDEIDIALPSTYFYPFKKHQGTKIADDDYIRPESFAIHYWGVNLEQKMNLYKQRR